MSKTTRREALKNIAMSVTLGGISLEAAQHVHEHAAAAAKKTGGVYNPKLFTSHEFKTVQRLAELIIPADDVSGSAAEAGAAEFIDLIANNNEEIQTIVVGGLQWLDVQMNKRYQVPFLQAKPEQQMQMLELIAYSKNANPDTRAGIRFFDWIRRLTADAFYTSPIGVKDIGYVGNKGMTVFQVPKEAIEYAVKRSGL